MNILYDCYLQKRDYVRWFQPKLSAVGPNFTIDMTWEGLIRLSLSKKQTKKQTQGVLANGDWAGAPWLQQHSESYLLGHFIYDRLSVATPMKCLGGKG